MEFLRPETIEAVTAALAQYGNGATILAGGSALTLQLQAKAIEPDPIISLAHVPGLDEIRAEADGLHIGPMITLRDLVEAPLVQRHALALATACGEAGNVRVRNQATLAGNLAEADYATDPPAMLLALEASVSITSQRGTRTVPLTGFFVDAFRTVLELTEWVTGILVPPVPANSRMAYLKYRSHSLAERPCVGVGVVAAFDGQICTDLRLAIGAACRVPQRLPEIEALAHNQSLTDELIAEIAEQYGATIETVEDVRGSAWYRREMIRVQVRRILEKVRDDHR